MAADKCYCTAQALLWAYLFQTTTLSIAYSLSRSTSHQFSLPVSVWVQEPRPKNVCTPRAKQVAISKTVEARRQHTVNRSRTSVDPSTAREDTPPDAVDAAQSAMVALPQREVELGSWRTLRRRPSECDIDAWLDGQQCGSVSGWRLPCVLRPRIRIIRLSLRKRAAPIGYLAALQVVMRCESSAAYRKQDDQAQGHGQSNTAP